ncbi:MAG: glutathione S-transferase family protein [Deltaproteobacteria bacterium]|nr:glutathione S-transferase family protein [Deltaproteobacteria bacterium]
MALTLYVGSKRYSSWSLRPYVALAHAGLPFETKTILLDQQDTKQNIAKVTPSARVPVFHDGDLVIWDSLAICEYIAEQQPSLWPTGRAERARARSISCEMHSGFAALRRDMPMDVLSDKRGQGHTKEALADAARVQDIWRECLEKHGGPFLFGEFSIADAMFAPVVTRFRTYGVELDAPLAAYSKAVFALPAMREWIADAEREPRTRE